MLKFVIAYWRERMKCYHQTSRESYIRDALESIQTIQNERERSQKASEKRDLKQLLHLSLC